MTQYIDKAAVVAEIDKIITGLEHQNPDEFGDNIQCMSAAEIEALNLVKDFIDTLEVKEVDLEKEIKDYIRKIRHFLTGTPNDWKYAWLEEEVAEIAQHFFKLGLKAQKEK